MKKLFRPLLVLVLGYALLTGFQMFLKVPMDGRLILAKLLLVMLAVAIIELLNRQPLAVRDVKAGHGQHGDAHFMEPEEVKRVYHEVQQGNETQPAMLVGASKSTWLVDTSDQSVLMVAPPGAGKSTSLYIPTITYNARVNLHTQDAQGIGQGASMVLVSVKDDLYTITGGELKKCGYRVLKLDLRNVFCSCHFNLLYRVNIEIDAWRKEQDPKKKAVHYATAERYAKVIASAAALKYLKDITNEEFPCQAVREGDSLDLGGKTLQFIGASNLHWPDSIYTYVPEDKVLFTCDSFGAHFASPSKKIFDDEVGDYRDAFDYYFAAILRPFSRFFLRAIEKVEAMEIKMICPGHGPVLRSHWKECVAHSKAMCEEFVKLPQKDMVLVAYVSAYGYTKALAEKIAEGIRSEGLQVDLCDVEKLGVGEIGAHAEKASGLIFGSPTINQNALPPLYNCFAALSPLRDRGKLAGGFGSYGWSGEAKEVIEANIKASKLDFVGDTYFVKFKPSEAELQGAVEYGVRFASKLK